MCCTKEFGQCCFSHGSNGESELIHTSSAINHTPNSTTIMSQSPCHQPSRRNTIAAAPLALMGAGNYGWPISVLAKPGGMLNSAVPIGHSMSLPQPGCNSVSSNVSERSFKIAHHGDWCEKCVMHHILMLPTQRPQPLPKNTCLAGRLHFHQLWGWTWGREQRA